jgi:hypothetical protein
MLTLRRWIMGLVPVAWAVWALANLREDSSRFWAPWPAPRRVAEARRRRLLFVHIPRTAGTSIAGGVYGRSFGHESIRYYRNFISYREGIESFAVVRDPVDRFMSAYRFVTQGGAEGIKLNSYWKWRTNYISSVTDYITFLENERNKLDKADYVMRSQSSFICNLSGRVAIDNLFLLEEREK